MVGESLANRILTEPYNPIYSCFQRHHRQHILYCAGNERGGRVFRLSLTEPPEFPRVSCCLRTREQRPGAQPYNHAQTVCYRSGDQFCAWSMLLFPVVAEKSTTAAVLQISANDILLESTPSNRAGAEGGYKREGSRQGWRGGWRGLLGGSSHCVPWIVPAEGREKQSATGERSGELT